MSIDDDYATWLDTYTELLIADLAAREYQIDQETAREFIEGTISMISTTTGTSEREARLSITESAVAAWATMLIEAEEEGASEFVAVSGVIFAALQTWANEVLPLIDVLDDAGQDDVPIDAGMRVAETIAFVSAIDLMDAALMNALELPIPEPMAHDLLADLTVVTDWMGTTDVAGKLREVDADVDLPDLDDNDDAALDQLMAELTGLGNQVVRAFDAYHRHIGDDPKDVLRYEDLEED